MSSTDTAALAALSPLDGRYRRATEPLRELLSESGLIRERIRIEAQWLLHLAQAAPALAGASLAAGCATARRLLAEHPPRDAAGKVKAIEARTNHDVKAVEYYVRESAASSRCHRRPTWSWCISVAPRRTSTISATRSCWRRRVS